MAQDTFVDPTIQASGTTWAQYKTGGLKLVIDKSVAANPAKTNPTTQATVAGSVATGGLASGVYYFAYTWIDAFGETTIGTSESAPFTSTGTAQLATVTIPSLPTGVQSANIYVTKPGGASGTETLYATGITSTTFACTPTLPAEQPGAALPPSNSTGAASHITAIYSMFGYGNERNIQGSRIIQDLSNYLSGYPIERRIVAMHILRWCGIHKLRYVVLKEIGTLIAANMPTATSSTVTGIGLPNQRWTLP